MGARTGTKTPLAGQARVSQAAAASAPADDYFDRDKFNKAQDTYQQILGRNPTQAEINNLPKASDKNYSSIEDLKRSLRAKNASQATISPLTDADRAASAAREVEKSRNTGVPLTQTPPGGVDDYYTPDNLRRDYEAANPGKNFERFLSSTEDQYGREAMAPVRSVLTSSPAPKPARRPVPRPSVFGRRVFGRRR